MADGTAECVAHLRRVGVRGSARRGMERMQRCGSRGHRRHRCHRNLPFVYVDDDGPLLPLPGPAPPPGALSRGFFVALTVTSVDPALGPFELSFITIFACISSSFAAFTFFGQNSVTNLQRRTLSGMAGEQYVELLTSTDVYAIYRGLRQRLASGKARVLFACRWQPVTL